MNETTTPGSAPDLLAILDRLAQAAFARDISEGDPCQYLQCKAELSAATRDAFAALRALRNQPPQPEQATALKKLPLCAVCEEGPASDQCPQCSSLVCGDCLGQCYHCGVKLCFACARWYPVAPSTAEDYTPQVFGLCDTCSERHTTRQIEPAACTPTVLALIACNQWFQAYHNGDARPEALEAKVPSILDMLGDALTAATIIANMKG